MRFTSFARVLVPTVLALTGVAVGCAPITLPEFAGTGAGGGFAGTGNFGGSANFDAGNTSAGETGAGGSNGLSPKWFGYMCGGSQPGCSTDPTAGSCAPGGNPNMGGAAPDSGTRTCQLVATDNQVEATCGMAGPALINDTCTSATACQADLGCVSTGVADLAHCRPFCCGDPEACPGQTYCNPTALIGSQLTIPVCIPVTQCDLLNGVSCNPGQTCAIVRNDGTTSCVDAGQGQADESCPCAAGYTCSNATGTCLKLCHIGGSDCDGGTCQGGTKPYPIGIGFCVPT